MSRCRCAPPRLRPRWPLALLLAVLVAGAAGAGGCREPAPSLDAAIVRGSATVRHVGLEGGFYGLVADDSSRYDPVNLDERMRVDGLRVKFVARRLDDQVSFHQWGTLVELVSIEPL